jgi:hypothetical protein
MIPNIRYTEVVKYYFIVPLKKAPDIRYTEVVKYYLIVPLKRAPDIRYTEIVKYYFIVPLKRAPDVRYTEVYCALEKNKILWRKIVIFRASLRSVQFF